MSIWSGVFFPADDPQEVEVPPQEAANEPIDTEVVSTDFQVDRENINEDTSVSNEVESTPEISEESASEEKSVEINSDQVNTESDQPVDSEPVVENPETTQE